MVFSERIATLEWLAEKLLAPFDLGRGKHVRVLHGGRSDIDQMKVIEEFGQAQSSVRLLLTGDMASEGVNLHRECHHLVHFDLPWSLITIEQRNGRIDRYGQQHQPDIRALLLTPNGTRVAGDLRILEKLLEREHHAHQAFGDAASLFGLHDAELESEEVIRQLVAGTAVDEIVPDSPAKEFDLLNLITGGTGNGDVALQDPPTLFESAHEFVSEAMRLAYGDGLAGLDSRSDEAAPTFMSIAPPPDLVSRLRALPQSYLTEQKLVERMQVTGDAEMAERKLAEARETTKSQWPTIGYLSPLHPLIDWAVDKVLVDVERDTAPVLVADVEFPTLLVQGLYSNGAGRPQIVEWLAVTPQMNAVEDMFTVPRACRCRTQYGQPR